MSRIEKQLQGIISGTPSDETPVSRIEKLIAQINADAINVGCAIDLFIDSDFKLVAKLFNKNGTAVSTSRVIDLPLESVVVDGSYNANTKMLTLELQNGNEIEIPVSGLINGLITSNQITVNPNTSHLDGSVGDICFELLDGNKVLNPSFKSQLNNWTIDRAQYISVGVEQDKNCAIISYSSSLGYVDNIIRQTFYVADSGNYVFSFYVKGNCYLALRDGSGQSLYDNHNYYSVWTLVEVSLQNVGSGEYTIWLDNGGNPDGKVCYYTDFSFVDDKVQPSRVWRHDGTEWVSVGYMTQNEPSGGGSTYMAGYGIDITNNVISLDLEEAEGQSV